MEEHSELSKTSAGGGDLSKTSECDSILAFLFSGNPAEPRESASALPSLLLTLSAGVHVGWAQRVPDPLVSIFGIGSFTPGALLYDALELFDSQSARADENLRLIGAGSQPPQLSCSQLC